MAIREIIPSTSVSMADIRDTLNANKGNVTNVLGSFFTEDAKIYKWARHKPLRFTDPFMPCSDAILNNYYSKGMDKDGNIGGIKRASTLPTASQTLYSFFGNNQDSSFMEYLLPQGGSTDPYRLGDFRQYAPSKRYALTGDVPFTAELYVNNYLGGYFTLNITCGAYLEQADNDYLLSGIELLNNSYYFGLYIRRANGNTNGNSWQLGGWDNLFITTQKPLGQYGTGTTTESHCTIYRVDEYRWSLTFKIPKKADADLTNSTGYFDSFVGKEILAFPICSDVSFKYNDSGSSSSKIMKLAVDYAHFSTLDFTLKAASASGNYKRPTVTLTAANISITYNNNVASVSLGNLTVKLTSKGGTSNYTFYVTEIRTSVSITGTDSSGNSVTIYKTKEEGVWAGNQTMSLSYVSGSTTSVTLSPGITATVNSGTSGLSNKTAYLNINVAIKNTTYSDIFSASIRTAINLNSSYT